MLEEYENSKQSLTGQREGARRLAEMNAVSKGS